MDDGRMVRRTMRMGKDEGMKEKSVGKGDGMGNEGEVRKQWCRLGGRLYIHTERESRQIRIKKKRICIKQVRVTIKGGRRIRNASITSQGNHRHRRAYVERTVEGRGMKQMESGDGDVARGGGKGHPRVGGRERLGQKGGVV